MKKIESMDFEEALAELERISSLMNEGKLPLKEAVELYETGIKLKNRCSKILEEVELRVNVISATQPETSATINEDGVINYG